MFALFSTFYGFIPHTGAHDPRPESCSAYRTVRARNRQQRQKQAQEPRPRKDEGEGSVKLAPV